jgi:hypothetical protein
VAFEDRPDGVRDVTRTQPVLDFIRAEVRC